MKIITELPAIVIQELEKNREGAWHWFSEQYDLRQEKQAADSLLVRVRHRFKLERLIVAGQAYRLYGGKRGREAAYSLPILCRALLLKYLMGWSYRRTCQEIRQNNECRRFVGYRLDEATLSYVTLQRFAIWVLLNQPRTLFSEILQQIDADFPEGASSTQVGDTFALLANVAEQSRTMMLRDGCRRLLHYLQQVAPVRHQQLWVELKQEELFGKAGDLPEYCLDKAQRDALEFKTALAADGCFYLVWRQFASLPRQNTLEFHALQRWLTILDKMLCDEFVFEAGEEAHSLSVRYCTEKERGSFVIGSTIDPEATFRKHGDLNQLGYNVQVAASKHFIREIFAQTGATNDGSGVADLVAHQLEHLGVVPTKLIYDRAAGSPKIFHDVAKAGTGKTQLVARLIDHSRTSTRFGPLDFTLREDGWLTCPNGKSTHTCYRSNSADGYDYRFSAETCQGCPLRQRCRGEMPTVITENPAPALPLLGKANKRKTTSHRQVFISDYRDHQRAAILYTKSEQFKLDMQFRSNIERIIAALVRYNDARHAHSKGTAKADFQARMAATAFNLKKWHKLTLEKEKATRYKPSDSS